jgi:hypothetical protein
MTHAAKVRALWPAVVACSALGCNPHVATDHDAALAPVEGMPDAGSPEQPPDEDRDDDGVPNAYDCAPDDAERDRMADLFADADGDGHTVGGALSACVGASSLGYASEASASDDCDDHDRAVWLALPAYVDADGDGEGEGEAQQLCTAGVRPHGFVAGGGDCAPGDRTRFRLHQYLYRDADGDLHTVEEQGSVCAGLEPPKGYAQWPYGADCDDADPLVHTQLELYADPDHDGVGSSMSWPVCAGDTFAGYARASGDCAPEDGTAWQLHESVHRDADGDGATRAGTTSLCAGVELPEGYALQASGLDCDDEDATVWLSMTLFADADGDRFGAGAPRTLCGDGVPPAGEVLDGSDCAPADALSWQLLTYRHVDHDGDRRTVPSYGQLCTGAALTAPYYAEPRANDCNDAQAALTHWMVLYPDGDGDGIGSLPYEVRCVGAALPEGFSRYGDDADDGDDAIGASDELPLALSW